MTTTHPRECSNRKLERLSDQTLLDEFGELVRRDQHHLASLLRHIDLIDRRKLWARRGYSSLFAFLVGRYHMSESTAVKRIGAARLARRFPVLFTMVARGELHLSAIHCIQAHLTPENHERVLAEAKHKTMRQLEELVARLAPKPDVPTTLRKLPNRSGAEPAIAAPAPAAPAAPVIAAEASKPPAPAPLPPRRDPHPTPLAPGRYRLQVTIDQSTRDKLEQLQDLLARQLPKGDVAAILERAFDALLVQIHKRKTGITAKPRAPRAPRARAAEPRAAEPRAAEPRAAEPQPAEPQAAEPQPAEPQAAEPQPAEPQAAESAPAGERTRYLEVSVRRKVWPRDDGRCGFVGEDGHRCNATRGLQFAHRKPWAKGGTDTSDNIGLRCPAHNALEADRDYGTGFMAHKRKQKSLKVKEPLARYEVRGSNAALG